MSSSLKKVIVRSLLGFAGVFVLCSTSTASAGSVVCTDSSQITGVECFYEVEGHGLIGGGAELPGTDVEEKQPIVDPLVSTMDETLQSLLNLINGVIQ